MTLPYTLTTHRPVQIGLIVLQSDETLEHDLRQLLPASAEFLVSRVPSSEEVSSDTLRQMEKVLTSAASLLPRGARFSAVGYGCTSGTAEIGVGQIAQMVKAGVDTPSVTEPVSALTAACRHMGVSRLAMISPYVESVSTQLRRVLQDAGISIVAFESFDEASEERVVRIAPNDILRAAIDIGESTDCDAVFLSCTNLRTLGIITEIEDRISKPVFSSNQVLAWHLGSLSGVSPVGKAPGRLFYLPESD